MKAALKEPYKQFFGTLANQVRLDIIAQLREGECSVGTIVDNVEYTQSAVSHSLRRLEECGFVTVEKRGKTRIYSLNRCTIKPLFELMEKHMNGFCKHVVERKEKGKKESTSGRK